MDDKDKQHELNNDELPPVQAEPAPRGPFLPKGQVHTGGEFADIGAPHQMPEPELLPERINIIKVRARERQGLPAIEEFAGYRSQEEREQAVTERAKAKKRQRQGLELPTSLASDDTGTRTGGDTQKLTEQIRTIETCVKEILDIVKSIKSDGMSARLG